MPSLAPPVSSAIASLSLSLCSLVRRVLNPVENTNKNRRRLSPQPLRHLLAHCSRGHHLFFAQGVAGEKEKVTFFPPYFFEFFIRATVLTAPATSTCRPSLCSFVSPRAQCKRKRPLLLCSIHPPFVVALVALNRRLLRSFLRLRASIRRHALTTASSLFWPSRSLSLCYCCLTKIDCF